VQPYNDTLFILASSGCFQPLHSPTLFLLLQHEENAKSKIDFSANTTTANISQQPTNPIIGPQEKPDIEHIDGGLFIYFIIDS